MKICPKCQRSYQDDLFFCLEDGTPLDQSKSVEDSGEMETQIKSASSADNEPESVITQHISSAQTAAGETEPIRVDIPPNTITSSNPVQTDQNIKKSSFGTFLLLAVVFLVMGLLGGAGLFWLVGNNSENRTSVDIDPTPVPTTASSSPTPELTEETPEEEVPEEEPPEETTATEKDDPESIDDILDELDEIIKQSAPEKPKGCYLDDGGKGGGEVRVRRYCDEWGYDCSKDSDTIAGRYPNGTPVRKLGGSVRTGGFTWIKISVYGKSLWVASSKIRCD
jgi:hypothetical protein